MLLIAKGPSAPRSGTLFDLHMICMISACCGGDMHTDALPLQSQREGRFPFLKRHSRIHNPFAYRLDAANSIETYKGPRAPAGQLLLIKI